MRVLCVGIVYVDTGSYATSYAACLLRVLCAHLVREPGLEFSVACSLPRKCLMRYLMRGSCAASRASPDPRILHILCAGLFRRSYARRLLGTLISPDVRPGRVFEECLRRVLCDVLCDVLCALEKSYASYARLMPFFCWVGYFFC